MVRNIQPMTAMSFYEDNIFPVFLDYATRPFRRDRAELIGQASGEILELGMGTGANLPYYSGDAVKVTGIEPCAAMLETARESSRTLENKSTEFVFMEGSAEELPMEDNSFDTVIACLVLCTIPDNHAAASEAYRVLKPGGKLLVLEHVASPSRPNRMTQTLINPAWRKLACGCQLTRDTMSVLDQAGFNTTSVRSFKHPKVPGIANQVIKGVAIKD